MLKYDGMFLEGCRMQTFHREHNCSYISRPLLHAGCVVQRHCFIFNTYIYHKIKQIGLLKIAVIVEKLQHLKCIHLAG